MSTQILTTKLYIPPARPQLIPRVRLIERLNDSLYTRLTLVSAPAGFGKSTLLSQWIAQSTYPTAWLSLDEADSDPTRFITYMVASLQTIDKHIGEQVLELLQSPMLPPMENLLTALLNDIAMVGQDFMFVLDDYHAIDSVDIDNALTFLLDHMPPQMHLVISTREDPQVPLARLRARSQLTELRIADVRFTADEATDFLNQMMNLNLSREDVIALETRTEGWIAGLQLAALSLRRQDDIPQFIEAFTGSHRFVLDYLVEEVLQHQPNEIRLFLLQTSILERLNGTLCDAVTGYEDSKQMLQTLERWNLFVIPLDNTQDWYRYHHLFADALRTHLIDEQAENISTLHRRASDWYNNNGFAYDAIYHALLSDDIEHAADLIELIWPQMDESYQSQTWVRWLKQLSEDVVLSRPILSLGHAWALLNQGDVETAAERLEEAEHWLDEPDKLPVVMETERFQALPSAIAGARAYSNLTIGNAEAGMIHAQKALSQATSIESPAYRQGTTLLGIAHWTLGNLQTAEDMLTDFMYKMRQIELYSDAAGMPFVLSEIWFALGNLQTAFEISEDWIDFIKSHNEPIPLGPSDVYRTMVELHCERNNLEQAKQFLIKAKEVGDQSALPNWDYRYTVTWAKYEESLGNWDTALDLYSSANSLLTPGPLPIVKKTNTLQARLWIRQGKLTQAQAWAHKEKLSGDDDITYLREFDCMVLVRLWIAQYQAGLSNSGIDDALSLLDRLEASAHNGGRDGSLIEIFILQALAHHADTNLSDAIIALEQASQLAEPEQFIRPFIIEGETIQQLLTKIDNPSAFVKQLQSEFHQDDSSPDINQQLLDPLSDRELEVLQLLVTDLTGPEIADKLMVSLNTMRTHTKNIYSKLGANSRRTAVSRAEELGLL